MKTWVRVAWWGGPHYTIVAATADMQKVVTGLAMMTLCRGPLGPRHAHGDVEVDDVEWDFPAPPRPPYMPNLSDYRKYQEDQVEARYGPRHDWQVGISISSPKYQAVAEMAVKLQRLSVGMSFRGPVFMDGDVCKQYFITDSYEGSFLGSLLSG